MLEDCMSRCNPRSRRACLLWAASWALLGGAFAPAAYADVEHVVQPGQTLGAIATRYHVTARALAEVNHLRDPEALRPGEVLLVPANEAARTTAAQGGKGSSTSRSTAINSSRGDQARAPTSSASYAMKAKTPGVIHVKRIATNEESSLRLADKHGRLASTTVQKFEKIMRSPSGSVHPIDPRLITLLGIVSNHFGSRKIEVISGFRPYSPTQFNPHSNHMLGRAVDYRVVGVPNEAVRDFCRTLKDVGCGYYPNSVFVHMDVRDRSAFWVDYSRPGERPRYDAANPEADEGTSDVGDVGVEASSRPHPSEMDPQDPDPAPALGEP